MLKFEMRFRKYKCFKSFIFFNKTKDEIWSNFPNSLELNSPKSSCGPENSPCLFIFEKHGFWDLLMDSLTFSLQWEICCRIACTIFVICVRKLNVLTGDSMFPRKEMSNYISLEIAIYRYGQFPFQNHTFLKNFHIQLLFTLLI